MAGGNVMSCQWVANISLLTCRAGVGRGWCPGTRGENPQVFRMTAQAGNPDVIDSSPGMSKADRKAVSACSEGPLAALPAGRIILLGGALG